MKIYIASDHAGFELKKILSDFLREQGEEVADLGPVMLEPQDDYPDYIERLAERVAGEEGSFGIAIGGSGEGEAMAANRVRGARAAEDYGGDLGGGQGWAGANRAQKTALGRPVYNRR